MADEPRAVTSASVEVDAGACDRQFVPLARHTADPFTKTADEFNVVPEAVAKPNQAVLVTWAAVSVESVVFPSTVSVDVTVDEEPTKPP